MSISNQKSFEQQTRLKWERYWLKPEPSTMVEKNEETHLLSLLDSLPLEKMRVLDIGSGSVSIVDWLTKQAGSLTVVDVSKNALGRYPEEVETESACFPFLPFPDQSFDLVICHGLIAGLPAIYHRLALSELARLVPPHGQLVCTTRLDPKTRDPERHFCQLVSTEFLIQRHHLGFYQLWEKVDHALRLPSFWAEAKASKEKYQMHLAGKKGLKKGLFRLGVALPFSLEKVPTCLFSNKFFCFVNLLARRAPIRQSATDLILLARKEKLF